MKFMIGQKMVAKGGFFCYGGFMKMNYYTIIIKGDGSMLYNRQINHE